MGSLSTKTEIFNEVESRAIELFAKASGLDRKTVLNIVKKRSEQQDKQGLDYDLAFPCFQVAKQKKIDAKTLAVQIAKKIDSEIKSSKELSRMFSKLEAVNGYVNLYYNWNSLASIVLKSLQKQFSLKPNKDLLYIVEFSSPNTNKPLHIGHVRNDCIGESIARIIKHQGFKVLKFNLINDRGIHICKAMLAYKLFGNNQTPEKANKKPDKFVGDFYVLFNKKAKQNPKLEQEAAKLLQLWESNDKETIKLWKKLREWSLQGLFQTYKAYNVSFDVIEFESEIYTKGKQLVLEGLEKGLFFKDDQGAVVVEFENLPRKVLLRSDGTSIYITQDLGLAVYRKQKYNFDYMIYVVASEQNLHFKQLFAILKKLGFEWADHLKHLSYGMVLLEHGKMKSREGQVIEADEFLQQMQDLAFKELKKRYQSINDEKVMLEKAKAIALAAIKFFMLKHAPRKDFVFKPEQSITFEGETGPYVQYTIARINSLLKKAESQGIAMPKQFSFKHFNDKELSIVKNLYSFNLVIEQAFKELDPSKICKHLIRLCQDFNSFYQTMPILKDVNNREKRLAIARAVRTALSYGLYLLNIPVLEEM